MLKHFKKHLLAYSLLPLLILLVGASYLRFVVNHDYRVSYEGECDPYTQNCFVYCEDEQCSEPLYHSWIERDTAPLYNVCGDLVTECEEAYTCPVADENCSISFCNSELGEECEELSEDDRAEEAITTDL